MSQGTIKYIAYFDTQDSLIKRNYVTSASNKLEYIAKVIASTGQKVDIISTSEVLEDKFRFYAFEKKRITDDISLILPFSWGSNNSLSVKIKRLWHPIILFFFLLFTCRKKDTVVAYHSLGYFNSILWAKRLKRFNLILEVEEIYSDVSLMSPYWRKLEFRMFDIADAFILSNDLLDAKINKHNKPSIVIYGTYQVEQKRVDKFIDGKIHAVYAGTFDPNKGGAQAAIMAAEYLPENYHIHICGFGTEKDTIEVERLVAVTQARSKSTITFDGLKRGDEFIEFLQRCHIGLSTQKPDGEYNDTSFPSKVLTYMANGLSVVSVKIPVLSQSVLSNKVSLYEKQEGKQISQAIMNITLSDNRAFVNELDKEFRKRIKRILG